MAKTRKISTQTLALGAMLTALVIVLQLLGSFIRFGMFSISLVLIPIVVGAAMCGPAISAWLGLVFGIAVLLSGDAAAFLAVSVPGTILTVLAKGVLCGLAARIHLSVAVQKEHLSRCICGSHCLPAGQYRGIPPRLSGIFPAHHYRVGRRKRPDPVAVYSVRPGGRQLSV